MYHHRSGSLKQVNKSHKTAQGSTSKRESVRNAGGKVSGGTSVGGSLASSGLRIGLKAASAPKSRHDKVNQSKQLAEQRRRAAAVERRLAGGFGPPKVVALVGLAAHARPEGLLAALLAHADDVLVGASPLHSAPLVAAFNATRQRVHFVVAPRPGQARAEGSAAAAAGALPFHYDLAASLAVLSAADVVVFVADCSRGKEACIDPEGDLILTALKASGLPSAMGIVTGHAGSSSSSSGTAKAAGKASGEALRYATRLFHTELGGPDGVKVLEFTACPLALLASAAAAAPAQALLHPSVAAETPTILRAISAILPKSISWRSNRSWLSAMDATYTPAEGSSSGSLSLFGYLRGRPLSVNQLICLPGSGLYKIEQIDTSSAPPFRKGSGAPSGAGIAAAAAAAAGGAASASADTAMLTSASGGSATAASGDGAAPLQTLLASIAAFLPYIKLRSLALQHPSSAPPTPGSVLFCTPGSGDSLDMLPPPPAEVDLDLEQTWPTEGEMSAAGRREARRGGAGGGGGGGGMAAMLEDEEGEEEYDEEEEDGEEGEEEEEDGFEEEGQHGGSTTSAALTSATTAMGGLGDLDMSGALPLDMDPSDPRFQAEKRALLATRAAALEEERARLKKSRMKGAKKLALEERKAASSSSSSSSRAVGGGASAAAWEEGGMGMGGSEAGDEEAGEGEGEDGFGDFDEEGSAGLGGASGASVLDASAERERRRRLAAAADNALFPDEVDTPLDVPARVRFGKYRGLKSFRSSPWDPLESLPVDYSRIFTLPNYARTARKVMGEAALVERAMLSLEGAKLDAEGLHKRAVSSKVAAKKALERRGGGGGGGGGSGAAAAAAEEGGMEELEEEEECEEGMEEEGAAAGAGAAASAAAAATAPTVTLAQLLGSGWVAPGQYISLTLAAVPAATAAALAACPALPLTAYSLLKHEARVSVCHFSLQRWEGYTGVVASKDALEFHCGPRVFDARPVFSEGGGGVGKSRLERFLPESPGRWTTASVYSPILFSPMPVLVFKREALSAEELAARSSSSSSSAGGGAAAAAAAASAAASLGAALAQSQREAGAVDALASARGGGGGEFQRHASAADALYPACDVLHREAAGRLFKLTLVARGSFVGSDANHPILKRIVLTGFPIKTKARFAAVRYMFFNPADVDYFKPVEVYTKDGARGHIFESVGTHGAMKCRFDKGIAQSDTVCLPLFKRVFPRWGACFRAGLIAQGRF